MIAHFFLPLSEPLAFPDQYTIRFPISESFEEYVARLQVTKEVSVSDPAESYQQPLVELKFSHARTSYHVANLEKSCFEAAKRAFPEIAAITEETAQTADPEIGLTLVQVTAQISDVSVESVSKAFDLAVNLVRAVQRSYYLVRSTALVLITRQRLPPFLPVVIQHQSGGTEQLSSNLHILWTRSTVASAEIPGEMC